MAVNGADLTTQRRVTYILLLGYFAVLAVMVGGIVLLALSFTGTALPSFGTIELPAWVTAMIAWMEGILGSQIGTLTGAVKDSLQFWLGSSFGSKTKDLPAAPGQ